VSLGDLLDRGAESRKAMDFLMRLQGEAQAAGGAVHVILGNHETMNLLGDLRYVDPGEYASYKDLEPFAERARLRQAWETAHGAGSGEDFDRKFPPGYFGHRAASRARESTASGSCRFPSRSRSTTRSSCMRGPPRCSPA
jgi:hypothetical protein